MGMTLRFPLREPGVLPSSVTQWVTKSRAWDLSSGEMAKGGRFSMKSLPKLWKKPIGAMSRCSVTLYYGYLVTELFRKSCVHCNSRIEQDNADMN